MVYRTSLTQTEQAFQDITTNPSFEITKRLPPGGVPGAEIIAHPEPLRAAYRALLQASPELIERHRPDIVLHVGLAVERDYFAVERGARRDGYHQYPDVDRQVIPKAEGPKIWGRKSAERLDTSLDLDRVVEAWRRNLRSGPAAGAGGGGQARRGKGGQKNSAAGAAPDVRLSDDVGDYVCGLVYYTSLAEMSRRGDGRRNVVFLHVPPLSGDAELEKGKEVVLSLIMALVESYS